MKPYGREKNLKGYGKYKVDYHMFEKHRKILNWWEETIACIPRTTIKKRIRKEIEEDL